MKKSIFCCLALVLIMNKAFTQDSLIMEGKIVFSNEDVVFHQIDEHTWVGSGHEMSHESLYLIEGNDKAILIDAGTNIKDLNKIVTSITKKPVTLVATHVHPDHTGPSINSFSEIYINPGDKDLIPTFMGKYMYILIKKYPTFQSKSIPLTNLNGTTSFITNDKYVYKTGDYN